MDVEEDRQLQYFGFTASQLSEDFAELSRNVIKETLDGLKEQVIEKLPYEEEKINNEMEKLRELFVEKSAEPLKKFEGKCKEIFALPTNIDLPGYVDEEDLLSPEEIEKLQKEVDDLEKEYKNQVLYKAHLEQAAKKFEEIQPLYEKCQKIIEYHEKNRNSHEKSIDELYEQFKEAEKQYYKAKAEAADGVIDLFNLFKKK